MLRRVEGRYQRCRAAGIRPRHVPFHTESPHAGELRIVAGTRSDESTVHMKRRRNIVGTVAAAVAEVLAATPITAADNARIESAPIVARARRGSLVVDPARARRIIAAKQIGCLHEHARLLEGCAVVLRREGFSSDFCESEL